MKTKTMFTLLLTVFALFDMAQSPMFNNGYKYQFDNPVGVNQNKHYLFPTFDNQLARSADTISITISQLETFVVVDTMKAYSNIVKLRVPYTVLPGAKLFLLANSYDGVRPLILLQGTGFTDTLQVDRLNFKRSYTYNGVYFYPDIVSIPGNVNTDVTFNGPLHINNTGRTVTPLDSAIGLQGGNVVNYCPLVCNDTANGNVASIHFVDSLFGTAGGGSGWALTGNTGTTIGTNFIGTYDVQPLLFKVANVMCGWIDITNENTSWGQGALFADSFNTANGYSNTAIGYGNMANNTTGYQNTAIGAQSLQSNSTGYSLTSLGFHSDVATDGLFNSTGIGANSVILQSNAISLGDSTQPLGVGIGTSAPQAMLHIQKNSAQSSEVGFRLNDGTEAANLFLTCDASGNAEWAVPQLDTTNPALSTFVSNAIMNQPAQPASLSNILVYHSSHSAGFARFQFDNLTEGGNIVPELKISNATAYPSSDSLTMGIGNEQFRLTSTRSGEIFSYTQQEIDLHSTNADILVRNDDSIFVELPQTISPGMVLTSNNTTGNLTWKAPTQSGATGSEPTGPLLGQFYFDTTLVKMKFWNGTTWAVITSTP